MAAALLGSGCDDSPERSAPTDSLQPHVALTDLEHGLEQHWTFEDHDGSQITDMSGNGRHGTLQAGSFVSSPWGEAVSLDGVDDYVSLAGPRDPALYGGVAGDFTISARVRVANAGKLNTLCSGCGPFSVMYIGTPAYGKVVLSGLYDQATTGKTWPQSTAALADNTWVNVTMVVEGGVGTRYYLDCALDATIPNANVGLYDYGYSSVGQGADSDRWFGGEIDDLRIWSRALSEHELMLVCADTAEPPCSGAPEGPGLVTPPSPPASSYNLPATDINPNLIQNAADLEREINDDDDDHENLILEDGFYDHADLSGAYLQIQGHHLWARNPGKVVLNFGISAGGNAAAYESPELHGLVFDIVDPAHGADAGGASINNSAAFLTWGAAHGAVIEDCTFNGNRAVARAISAASFDGLSIARVRIEDFTRFGILASNINATAITTPMSMTDIWIRNVGDPACWGVEESLCNYYPGTQEAGMFIGDRVSASRIFIRDVRAAGIVPVDKSTNSTFSHLDIDRIGVGHSIMGAGVYFEKTTTSTTVQDFCIGPMTRIGVNSEWDHNDKPRGLYNVVQNGLIQAHFFGVYFDQGVVDGLVQNITFRNYSRAGVGFYNNLHDDADWPNYAPDASTQLDNTFQETEIPGTRCDFTRSHWNSAPQCE